MASSRPPFALVNLANAFLSGPWTPRSLIERGCRASPANKPRMRHTVAALLRVFGGQAPPTFDALLDFLRNPENLGTLGPSPDIGKCFLLPAAMTPRGAAAASWDVLPLTSAGDVAAWLQVDVARLDWLADVRGWTVRQVGIKLRHYVYSWQRRAGGRFRLVESPKPTLKKMQRHILRELLERIAPHPAAHGFRKGRSVRSYAAAHVGRDIVLRFDLRDFFPSIPAARVHALFRTAGYPDEVARLLAGLCTSRTPLDVWESRPEPRESDATLGERLLGRHLPQGAPTSPALANLCARRLDARLHGLARSLGADYTRYADDLAFSGDQVLERAARRFQVAVAVIAAEEGFALHFQKSRFMRRGVRQQLAGVVVNQRPNVPRPAFDELKAILTNCLRHGPHAQNRAGHPDFRSHLLGRIGYVQMLNPARGCKLRALFDRIAW
jgi:hypothetical protein